MEATIALARLVRSKQPALYQYVYEHKHKSQAAALIDLVSHKPLLHVSSKFAASNGCASLVVPLAMHPVNKNAVIVYDLTADPGELIRLSPEEVMTRVFSSNEQMPGTCHSQIARRSGCGPSAD